MSKKLPKDGKIRCHVQEPSPFVVKHMQPGSGLALDLGCGNGRNAQHMEKLGFAVRAFDKHNDLYGEELDLGRHRLPVKARSADVVLSCYLLMFLDPDERRHLLDEITRVTRKGGLLVVELFPSKQAGYSKRDARMLSNAIQWYLRDKDWESCQGTADQMHMIFVK